jgi:hypothetical protein
MSGSNGDIENELDSQKVNHCLITTDWYKQSTPHGQKTYMTIYLMH